MRTNMCYSIPLYLYVSTEKIFVLEQSSDNTKLFSYKICKKIQYYNKIYENRQRKNILLKV